MEISPVSPNSAAPVKDDPVKVRDAAHQFEALLLGQMMQSMRDSEGGWFGTDSDDASSTAVEYAQEMFAQAMASRGGLGLADLVMKGLQPQVTPKAAPAAPSL